MQRRLKNRHIQLIAMGGAIGTGLFLGSAHIIESAGPSIILGYLIGGLIAFLIMRQLGEMIVQEPVTGSFSHFANCHIGDGYHSPSLRMDVRSVSRSSGVCSNYYL